jgi:hypothetical protein
VERAILTVFIVVSVCSILAAGCSSSKRYVRFEAANHETSFRLREDLKAANHDYDLCDDLGYRIRLTPKTCMDGHSELDARYDCGEFIPYSEHGERKFGIGFLCERCGFEFADSLEYLGILEINKSERSRQQAINMKELATGTEGPKTDIPADVAKEAGCAANLLGATLLVYAGYVETEEEKEGEASHVGEGPPVWIPAHKIWYTTYKWRLYRAAR